MEQRVKIASTGPEAREKSSSSKSDPPIEPLLVKPRTAARILDRGLTTIYKDIANGRLESFRDGSSRKITMRSIKHLIECELEAARKLPAESKNLKPTDAATRARQAQRTATKMDAERGRK